MTEAAVDHGTCRCGKKADKTSSGSPECWGCWNRRKLDLPAARYWNKILEDLLTHVDFYDLQIFFPKAGLTKEEMTQLSESLGKIYEHSEKVLKGG